MVAAFEENGENVVGARYEGVTRSGGATVASFEFKTPGCKWLDITQAEVDPDVRGGSLLVVFSYSTNFCCSWCPSCIRSCCVCTRTPDARVAPAAAAASHRSAFDSLSPPPQACCPFDDWGKNREHIDAVMAVFGGMDVSEEFGERGGEHDDLRDLIAFTSDGRAISPAAAADGHTPDSRAETSNSAASTASSSSSTPSSS